MRFEHHKNVSEILFEHDSVPTHTILETLEAITKLRLFFPTHHTAQICCVRFSPFWSAQRKERERFGSDEEVTGEVTAWLRI